MAAHKLPRLSKSLLDVPQLITESKFKEIAEVLENRDPSIISAALMDYDEDEKVESTDLGFGEGVGVLRVEGPTTYKPTGWEMLCGEGCSYTSLMSQVDAYAEQGVKTIVMQIDSPGGQAYRAFSTSRYIRRICDENDIRLIGYVDGLAASAGYALASSCHELVANCDSESGSIGVVVSLLDSSERDKKEGIKREYITAGSSKVPYDKDGKFKESFKQDLQEKINKTYDNFVQHVSIMRGIDDQVVRDTEAKVFDAETSLSLGLIDSIMEEDEFKRYISSSATDSVSARQQRTSSSGVVQTNVVETQPNLKTKEENTLMSDNTPDITPEMLAKLQEQLAAQTAQLEAYQAKEALATKTSLEEKLSGIGFLADSKDSLVSFFLSADEANVSLMNNVIESAQASQAKLSADLEEKLSSAQTDFDSKLAEANSKVENAEKEMLEVKKEFGQQQAVEGFPKDKIVEANVTSGAARTAELAALVKSKTANK